MVKRECVLLKLALVLPFASPTVVLALISHSLCCSWQDRRGHSHSVLLLRGSAGPREAGGASELAVHVLDDWWHLRLCHGLGHHPALR